VAANRFPLVTRAALRRRELRGMVCPFCRNELQPGATACGRCQAYVHRGWAFPLLVAFIMIIATFAAPFAVFFFLIQRGDDLIFAFFAGIVAFIAVPAAINVLAPRRSTWVRNQ
jgi:hypothetical protein